MEISNDMKAVFAKVLRVPAEQVNFESSPKTLSNWDSLRHVELVVEMEEKYNVSFSATEVFALTSVKGFCEMLAKKGVAGFAA